VDALVAATMRGDDLDLSGRELKAQLMGNIELSILL
jgi:hypothetical protein